MRDYPIVKVEIDHLRQSVSHMLVSSNDEINALIKKSLDYHLTQEWVIGEIDIAVKKCLKEAIDGIANNYQVRSAITELIGDSVASKLKSK